MKLTSSISSDSLIPGVAVFSRRAFPLAAWTDGLEVDAITIDSNMGCLILESGLSERWRYGAYRKSEATDQEAEAWEAAKNRVAGLHFMAIQTTPESDQVAGVWILQTSKSYLL